MQFNQIKIFLDQKSELYNRKAFIKDDPILIPHLFHKRQDIEIMGFFAAIFAWGQRITIINKSKELIERMGGEPYEFILHHSEKDLKSLLGFKHRTFNDTDLLYFVAFFHDWYSKNNSLEDAFANGMSKKDASVEGGLNHFRKIVFSMEDVPGRTMKHLSSPEQNSACKRINMFLRWMVRKDDKGVDFGIWKKLKPTQLVCPLDMHVQRVALKMGLLKRSQSDWKAAIELTEALRKMDSSDPVKYDFALFGLGIGEKY